ncbi:unnamed protein product, partial [Choristocarpus tenellus]
MRHKHLLQPGLGPTILARDGSKGDLARDDKEGKERPMEPELVCSCMDTSSPSSIVLGFNAGEVHVYHRLRGADDRQNWHQAMGTKTVHHPLRGIISPIESPPNITCVKMSSARMLAVGTSSGIVAIQQFAHGGRHIKPGGFHHECHKGKRVTCLHWDPAGGRLFSACEGGNVVMARFPERMEWGSYATGLGRGGSSQGMGGGGGPQGMADIVNLM